MVNEKILELKLQNLRNVPQTELRVEIGFNKIMFITRIDVLTKQEQFAYSNFKLFTYLLHVY